MDETEYLSTVYLLTTNPPLEERLQILLTTTRLLLDLDHCSILFLTDNGRDSKILASGEPTELSREQQDDPFWVNSYPELPDGELVVFRPALQPAAVDSAGGDATTSATRKKAIIGVDFRPHRSLEVRLRLTRDQQRGEFSDIEIVLIEKVIIAIRDAIGSEMQAQQRALFSLSAEKLFTHSAIGMLILNSRLEVLEKSPLADQLLEKTGIYRCKDKWLSGCSPEYQKKLEQTLLELTQTADLPHKTMDFLLNKSGEQYAMVIAKNSSPRQTLFYENTFTVFIFSLAEYNVELSALLDLWQISPAEKKVLSAIARFDNIKKVAIELNISSNTAKAQLKSAYKKLGIDSKTTLMKRLNLIRKIDALLS